MVFAHQNEVKCLKKHIQEMKQKIRDQASELAVNGLDTNGRTGRRHLSDGGGDHAEDTVNGGMAAGGVGVRNGSTTPDTPSWEKVDEQEAKQVLWIPDHASPSCMRYEESDDEKPQPDTF